MALVSLDDARAHLNIPANGSPPSSEHDALIADKLRIAEALVRDWVDQHRIDGPIWSADVASWDIDAGIDPPLQVRGAVLLQLGDLWRYRGDDLENERPRRDLGELAPGVTALLYRLRDPALA